jgi:hypothetical protein
MVDEIFELNFQNLSQFPDFLDSFFHLCFIAWDFFSLSLSFVRPHQIQANI